MKPHGANEPCKRSLGNNETNGEKSRPSGQNLASKYRPEDRPPSFQCPATEQSCDKGTFEQTLGPEELRDANARELHSCILHDGQHVQTREAVIKLPESCSRQHVRQGTDKRMLRF